MSNTKRRKKNGPIADVWRKLKKNKWAMVSLYIIIFLVLIAIFAPWIIPYDYAAQDYDSILLCLSIKKSCKRASKR